LNQTIQFTLFNNQVTAQAGQNVTIVDLKPELLEKAQKSIHTNLARVAKKLYKDDPSKIESFVSESYARIKVSTKMEDGANSDLIIEAIVEKLQPKQELFNTLDKVSFSQLKI
jgi:3-hydroxyacyl-CoA dehydrogenase